jgi:type IV pilus assembly protein PilQ
MSSTISSLRRIGIGALLFAGMSLQALAQGANRLEGITFTTGAGNKVELTLRLSDNAPTPLTFTVDNPARIALDLPDTSVAMTSRRVDVKQGVVDTVNVAEANGRTRVVLNVDNLVPYETRVSGNTIVVSVGGAGARAASSGAAVSTAAAAATQTTRSAAPVSGTRSVSNIDFRRGADGSGRIVVELTDARVPADLRQEGGRIVVNFAKTSLPENLMQRLDVTDFATPVRQHLHDRDQADREAAAGAAGSEGIHR